MRGKFVLAAAAIAVGLAAQAPRAVAEEPIPPPQPSRNLYGMTGLIDMPTAEMQPDAEFGITTSYFGGYLRNTITGQALPWLEMSFRYSVLHDMLPGPQETTLYDRSFDLKLRLIEEGPSWPGVVIGLQDFLGTGVYSGEYFAGTKSFLDGDLKVTGGFGWGRFAGASNIQNPLCRNQNRFCTRDVSSGTGGDVNFGQFFSGEDLGFFGGFEWITPVKGLSFKLEYSDDPYTRESDLGDFDRKTGVNVGVEYRPLSGVEVGAYYMYGSEVGVRLTLTGNPFRPLVDTDGEPAPAPLKARAAPTAGAAPGLGSFFKLLDSKPATTEFTDAGITDVSVPTRADGVRWAQAKLPDSADYVCPQDAARSIDAQYGVVDAVTFVHPDGTVVCTVALRPAGTDAVRHASRPVDPYPTGWFEDEAQRKAALDALVEALKPDRLHLFGIDLAATRVTVYIENKKFRSTPRAIGRVARALGNTMPASVELFEIVPVQNGLPLVSVTLERRVLEEQAEQPDAPRAVWLNAKVRDADTPDWGKTELALGNFPRMSWSVNPALPVNLFDPDQPLRFDLAAVAEATVEVAPGLSLSGAISKRIVGDLNKIDPDNDSTLPHVRSDIAKYLDQGDPSISRLTADYVTKFSPDIYGRLSAGLLERMFGGVSAELLWKPVDQSWGLGGEINWVKQRGYDQLFNFRDYDVVTGHASLYWDTGWNGISAQVDAGRYLAGDWGGTFTLKRRFANGWEFGGFATFTNVPFSEFGEGSFDKGLYLTIPFNWFLPYESQNEFATVMRPLSRDGGQRLEVSNRLYPMVEDMDRGGLRDTWRNFWE